MHLGVGIIIRNKSGNLFFIQEKDETYPVERFRNCYSLFGGKIEKDETPFEGLKRELMEEVDLGDLIHRMDISFIRSFLIQKEGADAFEFNLFEGILSDDDFNLLEALEVFEGRSKVLMASLEEMPSIASVLLERGWIWGLELVIDFYVSGDF